jgi:hypothetical protein
MNDFIEEIKEEFADFFGDFFEHTTKRHPKHKPANKEALINGVLVNVRPAYLFAERVDNLLKIIFGSSIAISAFTASFFGFATLSQLVETLVNNWWGRIIMFGVGISYLIIAIWKLIHLEKKP